jgi:hypothetical protein
MENPIIEKGMCMAHSLFGAGSLFCFDKAVFALIVVFRSA